MNGARDPPSLRVQLRSQNADKTSAFDLFVCRSPLAPCPSFSRSSMDPAAAAAAAGAPLPAPRVSKNKKKSSSGASGASTFSAASAASSAPTDALSPAVPAPIAAVAASPAPLPAAYNEPRISPATRTLQAMLAASSLPAGSPGGTSVSLEQLAQHLGVPAVSTRAPAAGPFLRACSSCFRMLPADLYSAAQLGKKDKRKCKACINGSPSALAGLGLGPSSVGVNTRLAGGGNKHLVFSGTPDPITGLERMIDPDNPSRQLAFIPFSALQGAPGSAQYDLPVDDSAGMMGLLGASLVRDGMRPNGPPGAALDPEQSLFSQHTPDPAHFEALFQTLLKPGADVDPAGEALLKGHVEHLKALLGFKGRARMKAAIDEQSRRDKLPDSVAMLMPYENTGGGEDEEEEVEA